MADADFNRDCITAHNSLAYTKPSQNLKYRHPLGLMLKGCEIQHHWKWSSMRPVTCLDALYDLWLSYPQLKMKNRELTYKKSSQTYKLGIIHLQCPYLIDHSSALSVQLNQRGMIFCVVTRILIIFWTSGLWITWSLWTLRTHRKT
jgi:hypothetical protein